MGNRTVIYEYTWELADEHGDITDQEFFDSLDECIKDAPPNAEIALLRRVIDSKEGEIGRDYDYIKINDGRED